MCTFDENTYNPKSANTIVLGLRNANSRSQDIYHYHYHYHYYFIIVMTIIIIILLLTFTGLFTSHWVTMTCLQMQRMR